MSTLKTAIIAAGLLGCLASTAHAAPHGTCQAYASKAVAQHQKTLINKCGIGGKGWSSNHQAHFNWCISPSVKKVHLTSETGRRKRMLDKCLNAIHAMNKPGGKLAGQKCRDGKNTLRNTGFKSVKLRSSKGVFCRFKARKQGQKYLVDTTHNSRNGAKIVGFKTY